MGQFETIHNIRTYVSTPKNPSTSGKQDTVIFLHDIFGPDLVNTKIVADEWAGQGFKVLLPDFFDNDPVPDKYLKVGPTLLFIGYGLERESAEIRVGDRT